MNMPNKRGNELSLGSLKYCCIKLENSNAVYPKEDKTGMWIMTKTGLLKINHCPFCGEEITVEDN